MEVGIRKCGVISRSIRSLSLSNQVVPRVSSYKYLGFPHGPSGIKWEEHVSECTSKALSLLNMCRARGDHWPTWVRLVIFRAFIRSRTEYGAPLLYAWLGASPERQRCWLGLENLYQESLKWICPMATHWKIAGCVVGVLNPRERFEGLAANFTQHLRKLAPDHLARPTLADWLSRMPWSPHVLLPRLYRVPLVSTVERRSVLNETSWVTELRHWYGERLAEQSAVGRVLDRSCRTSPCGPDRLIYNRNPEALKLALAWRCNSFAWSRNCPAGHRFNRACVNRCLVPRFPSIPPTPHVPGLPDHHCCLDTALNIQEYPLFHTLALDVLSCLH